MGNFQELGNAVGRVGLTMGVRHKIKQKNLMKQAVYMAAQSQGVSMPEPKYQSMPSYGFVGM